MRLLIAFFFAAAALTVVSTSADSTPQQPPVRGKGGAATAPAAADRLFELMSKGGDAIVIADQPASIRAQLEEFARANKIDNGLITRTQFQAFFQNPIGGNSTKVNSNPGIAAEEIIRAAGLSADGEALVEFFRQRMRPHADMAELLALARELGHADPDRRAQAAAKLLAAGPWAMPALRHVVNDLENPAAAKQARRCLEWLEGPRGAELTTAAAKLLGERKPAAASETLLAFLPFAGEQGVLDAVKKALDTVAARPGKVDAALLAALRDALPLRRAVAVEVLAGSGRAEVLPDIRKLLADAQPRVRLRAALALAQRWDEPAVVALIDLLAELPTDERDLAEQALRQLAGDWAPTPALAGDDDLSRKIRREVWAGWWQTVDGPALLAAFRRRTLTKDDSALAQALIEQLGDKVFAKREQATKHLIEQGAKVVALLREEANSADLEKKRRVDLCLKQIALHAAQDKLPLSAPRLLAMRDPVNAPAALLALLPFTEDRALREEVVNTVKSLVLAGGQAEGAMLSALSDWRPDVQVAAAEILLATGGLKHVPAVRKLLTHADEQVRLRMALALVYAQDKVAVVALIDLLAELPRSQAWEALDVLTRLAGAAAPAISPADDPAARKKLRDAWQAWWKDHGSTTNLAGLDKTTGSMSLIVVAELAGNGQLGKGFGIKKGKGAPIPGPGMAGATDRLVALDRHGQPQWQIDNLSYPIDFQMLPRDRVLIAEYDANRVTERDLKGKVLWEVNNLPNSPMNVQRLANGNTFIALYGTPAATGGYSVMEVDKQGKTVATFTGGRGVVARGYPRGAYKLADGKMVCVAAKGACIWLDAGGKEIKEFPVGPFILGVNIAHEGNVDVTSKGHVLVVNSNNVVAEYDPDGKKVWQADAVGNRATRLPNGNTLVASEVTGVVELDSTGKTVWQYQPPPGYQALRARPARESWRP
jgi:HEAT repeat protein